MKLKLLLLFAIGLITLAQTTNLRRLRQHLRQKGNSIDEEDQYEDNLNDSNRHRGLLSRHLRRRERGPTVMVPPGQRTQFNQLQTPQNPAIQQNSIYPQPNLVRNNGMKPNQQLQQYPAYVQVIPQPNQPISVPSGQQPNIQSQQVPGNGHLVPVIQNPGYVQQTVPQYQPVAGMQPMNHLNQNPHYVQVVPQTNFPQNPQYVQHQQIPVVQTVPQLNGSPANLNNVVPANGHQQVPAVQTVPQINGSPAHLNNIVPANGHQQIPVVQTVPQLNGSPNHLNNVVPTNGYQQMPVAHTVPQLNGSPAHLNNVVPANGHQQVPVVQTVPQLNGSPNHLNNVAPANGHQQIPVVQTVPQLNGSPNHLNNVVPTNGYQQMPVAHTVPQLNGSPAHLNNVVPANGFGPNQQGVPYNQPGTNVPQTFHIQQVPMNNGLTHNNQNSGISNGIGQPVTYTSNHPPGNSEVEIFQTNSLVTHKKIIQQQQPVGQFPNFQSPPLNQPMVSNGISQPITHTSNQPSDNPDVEIFQPNSLVTHEKIVQQQQPVAQFPNFQSPPLNSPIANGLSTTTTGKPTLNPRRMDLLFGSNLHEEEDETRKHLTVDIDPRMGGSTNKKDIDNNNNLKK